MIFEGFEGPFPQSKSIKNRFQNELKKQLHLTSVFLGLQTAKAPLKSAQEPPRRPQDAQHSRNLGATWDLRGGPRVSKWYEKLNGGGNDRYFCCHSLSLSLISSRR